MDGPSRFMVHDYDYDDQIYEFDVLHYAWFEWHFIVYC
jgi:hypothetical protein